MEGGRGRESVVAGREGLRWGLMQGSRRAGEKRRKTSNQI